MEPVYDVGQALKAYLDMKRYSDGEPMFENVVKFLDNKLVTDIQNKVIKAKWTKIPLHVAKFYDPIDHKYKDLNLDFDKLVDLMKNWTSATIMWLKPLQGIGNGLHAKMLTYREGMKGSIASKFAHIDGDAIDYKLESILFADSVYFGEYIKDGLIGDVNKNKAWLLAQKLNYIPDNYDYATNRRFILSTRNRRQGNE
jgi:hypothetical protein